MRRRPRWALISLGALIVIVLFSYPLWRTLFVSQLPTVPFPLTDPGRRAVFVAMPNQNMAATAYTFSLTVVPVPTEQQPVPVPADAVSILSGNFTQIDAVHSAQGTITIYRLINDDVLMRFDEFAVTNAPELNVYLSGVENPRTREDLGGVVPEFLVGALKGTSGSQQFSIPRELRLERYRSVVIVSEALGAIYSIAPLR